MLLHLSLSFSLQVELAEAMLWAESGVVAGLFVECRLQLCPGGLCHPSGAFPDSGAAHRYQAPTM